MTAPISELLIVRGALVRALLLVDGQRSTRKNREHAREAINAALRILQHADSEVSDSVRERVDRMLAEMRVEVTR